MQALGCNLHVLTENANFRNPESTEEIARQAYALAGLAKVFLVLAHERPQRPYSRPMDANGDPLNVDVQPDLSLDYSRAVGEGFLDNYQVRGAEEWWNLRVQEANERTHR
jgi:hypothetical protein